MLVCPADGRVLRGRGARIFLVFLLYVSLGTPLVTVSKVRMVLSTVTAVWGLGHPNPVMICILELVDQDETRGIAVVTFCLWPLVSLHTSLGVLSRRQFVNCVVLLPCFLGICCVSFVRIVEGHIYW